MTALSREALCFPRRHEWCLEEVRSPPVSWQKSCSLASACCRLLLSGSEYPVRSPAGALLRSPIRIILSLGCFSTHATMISQTSCCSTGLAAVNWYRLIMTNLPPLLVEAYRSRDEPSGSQQCWLREQHLAPTYICSLIHMYFGECRHVFFCLGGWAEFSCDRKDLTCERGSVGQSEGLSIPRSSVRFRLKPDTSNSHEFELHRPSNKGTKLLLKVVKAIIIILADLRSI